MDITSTADRIFGGGKKEPIEWEGGRRWIFSYQIILSDLHDLRERTKIRVGGTDPPLSPQ